MEVWRKRWREMEDGRAGGRERGGRERVSRPGWENERREEQEKWEVGMEALGKGEIERSRSDNVSDNGRRETGVEGGGNERGVELRKIKEGSGRGKVGTV